MTRYLLVFGIAFICAGTSFALRPVEACAAASEPPPARESTAELVQASVRGCVEALGLATAGVEDGVVVIRCRPDLGIVPVAKVVRR